MARETAEQVLQIANDALKKKPSDADIDEYFTNLFHIDYRYSGSQMIGSVYMDEEMKKVKAAHPEITTAYDALFVKPDENDREDPLHEAAIENYIIDSESYRQHRFGDALTAKNLVAGLALYKEARARYDGRNFFRWLGGLVFGTSKKERQNIAKMQEVFAEKGISKDRLNELIQGDLTAAVNAPDIAPKLVKEEEANRIERIHAYFEKKEKEAEEAIERRNRERLEKYDRETTPYQRIFNKHAVLTGLNLDKIKNSFTDDKAAYEKANEKDKAALEEKWGNLLKEEEFSEEDYIKMVADREYAETHPRQRSRAEEDLEISSRLLDEFVAENGPASPLYEESAPTEEIVAERENGELEA